MRALVIDHGLSRSALAAARGLAQAGWEVGIGAPFASLAAVSRSTRAWHPVPAPEAGLDPFVQAVNGAVRAGGYEVVMGSDDQHMLALSQCRSEVDAAVGYADHGTLVRAIDKLDLVRAADGAGLAAPRTEAATPATLGSFDVPVVVKTRVHSGFEGAQARAYLDPVVAATREEAAERAEWIRSRGGEPILQEVVQGELMAYSLVADRHGDVVVSVQQETELIWPPGAGISVRARTVAEDPELAGRCQELVRALGWFGLAELQFMRRSDGQPALIDLNGRFYGSLSLAVAAGANLPAAWAAVATGREPPPRQEARAGVRYHWIEGDLRRALRERRGGLLRDVAGTLAYAAGASHSVLRLRDPRPGLRYTRVLGARVLPGRRRGRGE